jgi:hypothetical protein
MIDGEEYLGEIFRQLVRKALAEVGLNRLLRAADAADGGGRGSDGHRILEGCRTFIFDCLEPPLEQPDLALARLAGTAPGLVRFQLPDDLRKTRPVVSSLRLWLDYREAHARAKLIMTGPRCAKTDANRLRTIREIFPELAHERFAQPPISAGELACLAVARRHGLEALTVKRKVASIPTAPAELLAGERRAFNGDQEVFDELRTRLQAALAQELRLLAESSPTPSSLVSS